MEKEEIEVYIAKNQISIDFDALENDAIEESTSLPNEVVAKESYDWVKDEVLFVAVKAEHFINGVNISNLELCGKKSLDWLLLASAGCESVVLSDPKENLISLLKEIKTDKKIIAVFYSDTPLVDRSLFNRIVDYFSRAGLNAMSLPRGYIFRSDYLQLIEKFDTPCFNKFDEKAFCIVSNSTSVSNVAKILQDKIKAFHLRNGVVMFGENTIFIDGDVEIEGGTVIYPNNIIKGQTVIGKGVILESGNIISDSIISDECFISDSFVDKSKLSKGMSLSSERICNQSL